MRRGKENLKCAKLTTKRRSNGNYSILCSGTMNQVPQVGDGMSAYFVMSLSIMNLQTQIKKTLQDFDEKFLGKCPDYHNPVTHASHATVWKEKMLNIKDLKSFLKDCMTKTYHIGYDDTIKSRIFTNNIGCTCNKKKCKHFMSRPSK